jgi:hypothetical protein
MTDPIKVLDHAAPNRRLSGNKIECNACPVLCQISVGRTGACDRWGNVGGVLTRVDPVVLFRKVERAEGDVTGSSARTIGQRHRRDARCS